MQIVKYKWDIDKLDGEPFLHTSENSKMKLLDEDICLHLTRKTCIGYTKKGKHYPCPKSRAVDTERVCNECAINDDFFLCVKCDGSLCMNDQQRNSCEKSNYYIYLAAFSNLLKVGISHEHRIKERLIEQGADMGAKVCYVQDGKLARVLEQRIKKNLNLIDRLSGSEKQKLLFGNPNVSSMNLFSAFAKLRTNGLSKYMITPEIYDLKSIYRLDSIKSLPKALTLREGMDLKGRIVAAKGNIVVFENNGLFSFDANKLIGFEVS